MREYTSLMDTPISFHRFFLYFCLPIDLIINGGAFLIALLTLGYMGPLAVLQLLCNLGSILLVIAIWAGAGRWQRYSYFAIFSLIWLHMAFSLFTSGFYVFYAPRALLASLLGAIFICTFGIFAMIYYLNRRHLFFPEENTFSQESTITATPQAHLSPLLDIDFEGDGDSNDACITSEAMAVSDEAIADCDDSGQVDATSIPNFSATEAAPETLTTTSASPLAVATIAAASATHYACDSQSTTIHFCADCGTKILRDDAIFCHYCGGKLR